jgi:periplasmic protein TonB
VSWRLAAWLFVSLALHAGLAGITDRLLGEVLADALFIDLTLVPLDEEPGAVARAEQNSAAPLGPGPAARSATEERAKRRHPTVQPSATPGETRHAPRAAAPEGAPAERTPAPAALVVPPPVVPVPAPAVPTPAPASPVAAPAPPITAPASPAAPPPANEPTVAAPPIPPGPPQVASLPAEARAPESSGTNPGRNPSPNASARERAEQGATGAAGAGARAGDDGAASGREDGAVALAIPGDGRGGEREYAAYYRLLRGRVVESVKYPPTARRDGLTGTVEMDLFVEPTGTISRVVVVASSSHRVLDDAAVAAVRRVGQVPFPEHLHPRPLRIRLPVVFVLQ